MRTTIDIDEDVLQVVRELARHQHVSIGRMASQLLRGCLTRTTISQGGAPGATDVSVEGFRPFPSRGQMISNTMVNDIRDREGV